MNTQTGIAFWRVASILTLSLLGVACTGLRAQNSDQQIVSPTIFASSAGDTIEIYPDRLVIDNKSYAGVDCSVTDYHCIVFDPIGAILVPKRCDNYRFEEWRAGNYSAAMRGIVHHTPILITTQYPNFAYFFINDPQYGIVSISYDKQDNSKLNEEGYFDTKAPRYPRIKTDYYKQEGPVVFPCEQ